MTKKPARRKAATKQVHYAVQPFLLVRDGSRYGVAQYAVDTSRQNTPYYHIRKWYTDMDLASNALQTLREVLTNSSSN